MMENTKKNLTPEAAIRIWVDSATLKIERKIFHAPKQMLSQLKKEHPYRHSDAQSLISQRIIGGAVCILHNK